jgi:hypothetical protein
MVVIPLPPIPAYSPSGVTVELGPPSALTSILRILSMDIFPDSDPWCDGSDVVFAEECIDVESIDSIPDFE